MKVLTVVELQLHVCVFMYLHPPSPPTPSRWSVDEWSPCSVTCGRGLQQRAVECLQVISSTVTIPVTSSKCPGPRPQARQWCEEGACHRWREGAWSKVGRGVVSGMRGRGLR